MSPNGGPFSIKLGDVIQSFASYATEMTCGTRLSDNTPQPFSVQNSVDDGKEKEATVTVQGGVFSLIEVMYVTRRPRR
jgi:hypothetical protein